MGDTETQEQAATGVDQKDEETRESTSFDPITSQEEFDKRLASRLNRERAKFSDYDELKAKSAKLDELEAANKSELQKLSERAEAAEKRAVQAEFTALREKVARTKGVPASSLTGETEEELNASADELIAWRDQNSTHKPKPPVKDLKSGTTGTDTPDRDPKAAAAEALRKMRSGG